MIDWNAVKTHVSKASLLIARDLADFLDDNPLIRAASNVANYPPRLVLEFERRPGHDSRPTELYDGGYPRLAVMPDDDKRVCAAFVASLAETLKLRPWLAFDGDGKLRYTMKPNYKEFRSERA